MFRRLSIKRKSLDKNNNNEFLHQSSPTNNWRGSHKPDKTDDTKNLSRLSIYATMRRPRKNPMSRAYDNDNENEGALQGRFIDTRPRMAVIHNVENVRINGRLLHKVNSPSQDSKEISFEEGYHTLPARTNPWRNYETDILNDNHNLISLDRHNERRRTSGDSSDSDDENIEFNDRKRISSIKRRSKHARYSNPSLQSDDIMVSGEGRRERSKSIDKRYVSDFALGTNRKNLNRRRSNEINRSTTLYWDGKVESPTSPDKLVFNVSMNAKIQTRFKDTILHSAAANGNIDIVRFYADSEQYLNAQNGFKNTPLHCAIIGGREEIIDMLLKKNVVLALANIDGETAFHLAVKSGMDSLVCTLVEMDSSCINIQNNNGESVLHQAVVQGNQHLCDVLIQNGASLYLQTNKGDTPLHICSHLDIAFQKKLLLTALNGSPQSSPSEITKHDHVSKTNELNSSNESHVSKSSENRKICEDCIVNVQNKEGNSLLHCFSSEGTAELVRLVLSIPCTKTKLQNADGETALHVATGMVDWELIKLMIQEDLELLNIGNANGDTILHVAVRSGFLEIAENLISYGSDINRRNKVGNTPPHSAIIGGHCETLRLLLDKNANISGINNAGESALHLAVRSKNLEIFYLLLDFMHARKQQLLDLERENVLFLHGHDDAINSHDDVINININLQDHSGNSPLHICVIDEQLEMFTFLAEQNTDWKLKNSDGETVLHLIARYNRLDFFHKLEEKFIDTECENASGYTPWDIAMQLDHSDIALMLLEKRWNLNFEILNNL